MEIIRSIAKYITNLGISGWLLMGLNLFTALGAFEFYTKTTILQNFPAWGWLLFLIIGLLLTPFVAFHRMRIRLQSVTETRARELARLILEARDKAAKVVMLKSMQNQDSAELMDASKLYLNALEILDREADIDGGKIREAIREGFTTFVSFHVTRFLAWNGKIVSDMNTKQKLEIGELQFIGRMASRADETIQNIRSLTR